MKFFKLIFTTLLVFVYATPFSLAQESDILEFLPAILAGAALNTDNDRDGYSEKQGDCNDTDPSIHPCASEICEDGVDQDCSGSDKICDGDAPKDRLPTDIANMTKEFLSANLVDIDLDGDLDLVLGVYGEVNPTTSDRILVNNGCGYFFDQEGVILPPKILGPDWLTTDIGSLDVNLDGYPDLIMSVWSAAYSDTRLQLLINNQDGTFTDSSQSIEGNGIELLVHVGWTRMFDIDQDGLQDFFTPTAIYHNNGGSFSRIQSPEWLYSATGDFNNDSYPDLFWGGEGGQIYLNTFSTSGQITFAKVTQSLPVFSDGSAATVSLDLANDGDTDLVVAQYQDQQVPGPVDMPVLVFENTAGTISLAQNQPTATASHPINTVRAVDLNNDGLEDVFIGDGGKDAPPFLGGQNRILIQNLNGDLIDETESRLPIQLAFTHGLAIGDIDRDGDEDIFIVNIGALNTVSPHILLNDGNGFFSMVR